MHASGRAARLAASRTSASRTSLSNYVCGARPHQAIKTRLHLTKQINQEMLQQPARGHARVTWSRMRKLVFTGAGTYRSDVSNDVSHVLTNFFTKL
jgi:hypothetical protein